MKSQLLGEFETGKMIATAVEKGKTHDFKLPLAQSFTIGTVAVVSS